MKYSPYIRPVPGASTAVLMIHGIVGTPAHFQGLLPVIPEDWSIYNILLDGHGKQVEDFAQTSMAKWKAQVSRQLDEILQTHRQVVIVAHSMGTLFAIEQAIKRPDRIKALFLLAVPLTPRVHPSVVFASPAVAFGRVRPGSVGEKMLSDCGVQLSPKLWKYITWFPRFWELLQEARSVRNLLPGLTVPCFAFQSRQDELVSRRACKYLAAHPKIQTTVLPGSGHFAYDTADLALLQSKLKELLYTIQ